MKFTTRNTIVAVAISMTLSAGSSFARGGDHPAIVEASIDVVSEGYGINVNPGDYKVFIEEPTGNAFISVPHGWRFMKKLDEAQLETAKSMWLGGVPEISVGYEAPVSVDNDINSRLISQE